MKQTRIFIRTTLGKQSLKQMQSQSTIYFCSASQIKLSHKTTDAALKIPQNLTINSGLFPDKPNSPGEGCRESPCPQAREGTKEVFFSLVMTPRMTLPKRMSPCRSAHPAVKYSPARPSPDNGDGPAGDTRAARAVPTKLPPTSPKSLPLPHDGRRDRCIQNPEG